MVNLRSLRAVIVLCLALVGCDDGSDPPADAGTDGDVDDVFCSSDAVCDDGVFCNGREWCSPTHPDADERGCIPSPDGEPCLSGQICREELEQCITDCDVERDADRDGREAIECGGDDCDDADPDRYPGNVEVCDDGHDEDCNPDTLGGPTDRDRDADGFISMGCCNEQSDGTMLCGTDCVDSMVGINPGTPESCNGIDDDCDGTIDDGVSVTVYVDADGDGYGAGDAVAEACPGATGFAAIAGDCDDGDLTVNPGQVEICDDIDNDCDGEVDEGATAVAWYPDLDGDGFGSAASGDVVVSCEPVEGASILPTDCDDGNRSVSPIAEELCDGLDNDCNGRADYRLGPGDFEDDDDDGFVDQGCAGIGDDCDDFDRSINPEAPELCDGLDNDCDGVVDDETVEVEWYLDRDHDGFGDASEVRTATCEAQPGWSIYANDCDDYNVLVFPGAFDGCDGIDNDCDEAIDEDHLLRAFFFDADHDGFGGGTPVMACALPGASYHEVPLDCDEGRDDVNPDAPERCDGVDNDCNFIIDDAPDTTDDPANCGECGFSCEGAENADAGCVDSHCALDCHDGWGDCNELFEDGCEHDVTEDVDNCGRCGHACTRRLNAEPRCVAGECRYRCLEGYADCNLDSVDGCEVRTDRDVDNCGECSSPCLVEGDLCVFGACVAPPFPADDAVEALAPAPGAGIVVLASGVHHFTSIHIPEGVTLMTDGAGVLELYAAGDVLIEGTIDLSGGRGGNGCSHDSGGDLTNACNGGGGYTGTAVDGAAGEPLTCNPGGEGGLGGHGEDAYAACGGGGHLGGGSGGSQWEGLYAGNGGGGGGGFAGGGGGSGGWSESAGGDGASVSGFGSGGSGEAYRYAGHGGESSTLTIEMFYRGADGEDTVCGGSGCTGSGGGGGSIGERAALDLEVTEVSFLPGSSGGGGGGGPWAGGGGGGGGGGALRIATTGSLTISSTALVTVRGGDGGDAPHRGGSGGGGSGGVLSLSSPELIVEGIVDAGGGLGGESDTSAGDGGDGGLGRIRISTVPEDCQLFGTWTPPLLDMCRPTDTPAPGTAYVGLYPD